MPSWVPLHVTHFGQLQRRQLPIRRLLAQPAFQVLPQRLPGIGGKAQAKGAAGAYRFGKLTDPFTAGAISDLPGLAEPARQVLAVIQQQRLAKQLLGAVFQDLAHLLRRYIDHRRRVTGTEADQVFAGDHLAARQGAVITQAR